MIAARRIPKEAAYAVGAVVVQLGLVAPGGGFETVADAARWDVAHHEDKISRLRGPDQQGDAHRHGLGVGGLGVVSDHLQHQDALDPVGRVGHQAP